MITQNIHTDSKSKRQLLEDIEDFDGWLAEYKMLIREAEIDHSVNQRTVAVETLETVQAQFFQEVLRE
jgi:hypothetical protein